MKTKKFKQSRNRVKTEEKPTIPKTNIDLSSATTTIKKPQIPLGKHMLDSMQGFHPLGKKSEKKTGISSFRGL